MTQQAIVFGTILFSLIMFISGRLRYDIVAIIALLIVTITGVVKPQDAFLGFGNPVVITVAAVLIISRGLMNVGAVDILVEGLDGIGKNTTIQIAALTLMTAVFSSFMNNVGALALVMPVTIRIAKKTNSPTSILLMPIAFGSLLGGLTTLIGTPPNIIIASYRAQNGLASFGVFDFAKVGLGLAVVGILYISLIGWRLIPSRKNSNPTEELFKIEDYITEICVPPGSLISGKSLGDLSEMTTAEINILSIIRNKIKILSPSSFEVLQTGDIIILQADSDEFKKLVEKTDIGLPGGGCNEKISRDLLNSNEHTLVEAVVRDDSPLVGQTAKSLQMRPRYNVNMVAVSRQGERIGKRLKNITFKAGDIVLFQAQTAALQETLGRLKCLPLADRDFKINKPYSSKKVAFAVLTFALAILLTTLGLLSTQVAFVLAALIMVMGDIISPKDIYENIDWPIIVLLGALLPVGEALEQTGGSYLIANVLFKSAVRFSPVVALLFLMLATIILTNVINNAAAAVLMAPIAFSIALRLGISTDPFLMAVAVASSSAFLTPIGHQSNTLVMGPGGYHFKDYWLMGLPLTIIVLLVGVPLILYFWPL